MESNFKIRMGEVEEVLVTYNFESAWQRSTTIMNPETTQGTLIRYTLDFFGTKVTSERNPLPKGG